MPIDCTGTHVIFRRWWWWYKSLPFPAAVVVWLDPILSLSGRRVCLNSWFKKGCDRVICALAALGSPASPVLLPIVYITELLGPSAFYTYTFLWGVSTWSWHLWHLGVSIAISASLPSFMWWPPGHALLGIHPYHILPAWADRWAPDTGLQDLFAATFCISAEPTPCWQHCQILWPTPFCPSGSIRENTLLNSGTGDPFSRILRSCLNNLDFHKLEPLIALALHVPVQGKRFLSL